MNDLPPGLWYCTSPGGVTFIEGDGFLQPPPHLTYERPSMYKTQYEKSIGMQEVWPPSKTTPRESLGNELISRAAAVSTGISTEASDEILGWYLRGLGGLGSAW